jgi:hypothetical protein
LTRNVRTVPISWKGCGETIPSSIAGRAISGVS